MKRIVPSMVAILFLLSAGAAARAENWPQWRGPAFDGSSKATGVPEKISLTENLVWKAAMPGPSSGTPIVWESRIFVSSLDLASKKLLAICLDRKDGRELWRKEVGVGFRQNNRNNMASPSPITDGKHVWFHYATGDLVCFDLEGKQIWARNLVTDHGPFNYMWIYGSSPLLYQDKLFVQVIHRDTPYEGDKSTKTPSYLLAINPLTGKDIWKHARPDEAVAETKEAYGTPIPFLSSERGEVVLVGGDVVTGHDPKSGAELWRAGNWNPEKIGHWRMVPSVVTGGGIVVACAPKNGPVIGIKAGGSGKIPDDQLAWNTNEFTSDVCIPLFYDEKFYVLNGDKKKLTCVEPKTGKVLWEGSLGGRHVFRASPTCAEGKIYCVNEGGEVWVLSADKFEILGQAALGGEPVTRASIALSDGHAFIRTADTLYCFGKK